MLGLDHCAKTFTAKVRIACLTYVGAVVLAIPCYTRPMDLLFEATIGLVSGLIAGLVMWFLPGGLTAAIRTSVRKIIGLMSWLLSRSQATS